MKGFAVCLILIAAFGEVIIDGDTVTEADVPRSGELILISFEYNVNHLWWFYSATGTGWSDLDGSQGFHNGATNKQEFPLICNIQEADHEGCRVGTHEFSFLRQGEVKETKTIKINFI